MLDPTSIFGLSLGSIPLIDASETRSICAENPTGAVSGGATATPAPDSPAAHLGKGWKARPCIDLDPGTTTTLAEVSGPGLIQHIWITVAPRALRDCVLRMHWDGEPTASSNP